MDGQRPNANGSKELIPGVPGSFLPSFLAPTQFPNQASNQSNSWTKPFQTWTDPKNFNMYNMFGNMGTNGAFSSSLDSFPSSSSSQSVSNLASNPLLAAFQQQGISGYTNKTTNSSSSLLNPGSFNLQPEPVPSTSQSTSKQSDIFSSLPSTSSSSYSSDPSLQSNHLNNYPFKLDDYVNAMNKFAESSAAATNLQQSQQLQQGPSGLARPVPRPAPPAPSSASNSSFDLLAGAKAITDKNPASGFDFSQIFNSPQKMQQPSMLHPTHPTHPTSTTCSSVPSTVEPSHFPPQISIASTSSQSYIPPLFSPPIPVSAPSLQIPSTSNSLNLPLGDSLISPRIGKRRSGGDPNRPPSESGLDFNLDGIDLFEGLTQKDQDAMLNATNALNIDFELFNDPIGSVMPPASVLEPPKQPEPVHDPIPVQPIHETAKEPEKTEPDSAQNKMARFLDRLKNKSGDGSRPETPSRPTTAGILTPQTVSSTDSFPSTSIEAFMKPRTPQEKEKSDRLTFTPPHSPIDLSKPSTSGISSLISASILPSELTRGPANDNTKKNIPIYLREKTAATPAVIPSYKKVTDFSKSFQESKDDEFAFTDEDPEEENEKFDKEDFSDDEDSRSIIDHKPAPSTSLPPIAPQPKYIPGVGFDVTKDEAEKNAALNKESKKPVPIFPAKSKQPRQESLEFADRLRKKFKERINLSFSSIYQSEHNECAIDSVQRNVEDADKPPLPRLLIRLPRKSDKDRSHRRKKKRKHYYEEDESEEDDDDWYGGKPKRKKRGRKPKSEMDPEETFSVRLVDPSTIAHARKEVELLPVEYLSKKQRLMRSWNQERSEEVPRYNSRGISGKVEPKSLTKIVAEFKPLEVRERVEKFRPCSGFTSRGTFLVLKNEIGKDDCSLWRVDNMNLLQKFPGFTEQYGETERILYKNSSTYSGWCEQLQAGYMVVDIKYIRQTRSETVVEPEIPVADLFPAIAEELNERYCDANMRVLLNSDDKTALTDARTFILKDDIRNALFMVIRNMLDGASTFEYFEKAEQKQIGGLDNPEYELLTEVECEVRECLESIDERVTFPHKLDLNLHRFASISRVECQWNELDCQACGEGPVSAALQFFDKILSEEKEDDSVDGECSEDEENSASLLPVVDTLVCRTCAKFALWKHRLIHFRLDLIRRIEDRLLEGTLEVPTLVPEQIIENLRSSYIWLKEVILSHTSIWDEILKSDEEEEEEEKKEEKEEDRKEEKGEGEIEKDEEREKEKINGEEERKEVEEEEKKAEEEHDGIPQSLLPQPESSLDPTLAAAAAGLPPEAAALLPSLCSAEAFAALAAAVAAASAAVAPMQQEDSDDEMIDPVAL